MHRPGHLRPGGGLFGDDHCPRMAAVYQCIELTKEVKRLRFSRPPCSLGIPAGASNLSRAWRPPRQRAGREMELLDPEVSAGQQKVAYLMAGRSCRSGGPVPGFAPGAGQHVRKEVPPAKTGLRRGRPLGKWAGTQSRDYAQIPCLMTRGPTKNGSPPGAPVSRPGGSKVPQG